MPKEARKSLDTKAFVRKVFYSKEDGCWVAIAPELLGCAAHGDTSAEALRQLGVGIELHLRMRQERGSAIPKAVTEQEMGGRLLLRLPKVLQRHLKEDAAEEGVSVNQYALFLIAMARGQLHPIKV